MKETKEYCCFCETKIAETDVLCKKCLEKVKVLI